MPKETINTDTGYRTVVKWRKDAELTDFPNTPGHVLLATVNPAVEDADEEGAAGWYAQLDGEQIDYLITVLRKARRQAFPDYHSSQAGGFSYSGSATFAAESRTFPYAV